jgi:hypothetical protein
MSLDFFMVGPPLILLFSGIAILVWPKLLNYIIALYLILFGLVGLVPLTLVWKRGLYGRLPPRQCCQVIKAASAGICASA